jgi:hypothetical protein
MKDAPFPSAGGARTRLSADWLALAVALGLAALVRFGLLGNVSW